jgi:hypothetical protein
MLNEEAELGLLRFGIGHGRCSRQRFEIRNPTTLNEALNIALAAYDASKLESCQKE